MQHRLSILLVSGLVAVWGHVVAGRAEAAPQPGHQELQEQIERIPPAWSQTLPAATRFVEVMGGVAVLDKETGIVWEKSPATSRGTWAAARIHCNNTTTVGNRKGWRLPTAQELASLLDPSASSGPMLPSGHPFPTVQSDAYWTATHHDNEPGAAWFVNFADSQVFVVVKTYDQLFAWCVRGHGGADAQ